MERNRRAARAATTMAMAALAACGGVPELHPAPGAELVRGVPDAARATQAGVQLTAEAGAWGARPLELPAVMTPLRVAIQNGSGRPIRIRHQDFVLLEGDGDRRPAVPPYRIEEQVARTVTPAYAPDGFYLAPYLDGYYDWALYADPFPYDGTYYGSVYPYYSTIRTVQLPTDQMVDFSLAEGVLDPNGHMEGFLYFEKLDGDAGRVRLTMELVDARTQERLGTIEIPFATR